MLLWGIEKRWFRVGGCKLLWYFFANVLMRFCGLTSGLLCFLQFIVCGSWCLYAFVETRISCVFFLRRYYRFAICFTIRFVHFTCVFWCDSCEMRKWNVVQRVAWSMNRLSDIWDFCAVEIVKRGVLFMFLSPFGMFLCIYVCLSFYLFNDLYIWITKYRNK